MTLWGWIWVSWLAAFGVLEGIALASHQWEKTLSGQTWLWFAIRYVSEPRFKKPRRLALVVLMVWLTLHFLTGGWV